MRQIHIKEWTAVALLTCGVLLAFVSLLMPPPGEIHESVLYIFAQILIYAGSIFGIDAYIHKSINQRSRHEHFQDPEHRRNPNDRGDPEEED